MGSNVINVARGLLQKGGNNDTTINLAILFGTILILLIEVYLVKMSYNYFMQHIMIENQILKPCINMYEAFIILILFQTLFS